jgi:tetratricopeptide (TPR) repeat protein/tRNA A-37 threonylcarbamoyl transferase component Bud32
VGASKTAMDISTRAQQALSPQYEALVEIGRGASATVFRARDVRHDRVVAIKILNPDLWSANGKERFRREIQLAAGLDHPNVLPLFDSGDAGGLFYYTMPYVEGETLRDRIRRSGPLPVDEAVNLTLQVAAGLRHAHERGLVHRDIKPSNILLAQERAILADFGIARPLDDTEASRLTSSGIAPGTPAYMSPEHAGAEDVDERSDLYSLGCVLYEALAGEPPFTGRTVQAVVARHMYEAPPSLTIVRPAVPAGVVEVIDKTLQKVPADRYQTAEEFEKALQSGRTSERRTRRRARSITPSIAAVGALAIAAMAVYRLLPEREPLDPNRIVGLPLVTIGGADPSARGWDVALAIGTALEHAEPIRWIDGWLWLPEAVRQDFSAIDSETAREVATRRGAGRYVTGFLRDTNDSLAVTLALHDARSGDLLAQETARGAAGSPPYQLGLAAAVRLLPNIVEPGRTIDLSPLTDRAPSAVALTIQGDRAYRAARFDEALSFYRRALEEDSLMAIAAARGARAASWVHEYDEAVALAERALENEDQLPERHRLFVRGVDAFEAGRADSAVSYLNRALQVEPEWAEASALLGETYYHLIPPEGSRMEDALTALLRAIDADSTFTPPFNHAAEIALSFGDLERAAGLANALESQLGADSHRVRRLRTMIHCVQGERSPQAWDAMAAADPNTTLDAGLALASRGAHPECGSLAFAAIDRLGGTWTWSALLGHQAVQLARGRIEEARAELDSLLGTGETSTYYLYTFNAGLSSAFADGATEAAALERQRFGESYAGASGINLWLSGSFLAENGDLDEAGRLADAIRVYAAQPRLRREASMLADAVEARITEARGSHEAAIEAYRALSPSAPPSRLYWQFHESLAAERIRHARLLLATGSYDEALRIASIFDHAVPFTYVMYMAPSLEIRARAAEALGMADVGRDARDRLAHLGWPDGRVPLSMTGPLLLDP